MAPQKKRYRMKAGKLKRRVLLLLLLAVVAVASLATTGLWSQLRSVIVDQGIYNSSVSVYLPPPRVVWAFWMDLPTMSSTRRAAFDNMVDNLGVPVRLITLSNVSHYNVSWDPIHPAISEPYLSDIHKGDYLRAYFMRHYGGGYHDIKWDSNDWSAAFDAFDDPNVWVVGTYELGEKGVACDPKTANAIGTDCGQVRAQWMRLASNVLYIMRPSTPFAITWLRIINERLDAHQEKLRQHPAPMPRCCKNGENGYPLRWAELHGEQFHPLQTLYIQHVRIGLPRWDAKPYI